MAEKHLQHSQATRHYVTDRSVYTHLEVQRQALRLVDSPLGRMWTGLPCQAGLTGVEEQIFLNTMIRDALIART